MFPFIQCQCFDKRRGVFLVEKKRFLKIRVLFWPEISVLGVFLNFDNERMHPLNTLVIPRELTEHTRPVLVRTSPTIVHGACARVGECFNQSIGPLLTMQGTRTEF